MAPACRRFWLPSLSDCAAGSPAGSSNHRPCFDLPRLSGVVVIPFVVVLGLVDLFVNYDFVSLRVLFPRFKVLPWRPNPNPMYLAICLYSLSLSTPLSSLHEPVSRFEAP